MLAKSDDAFRFASSTSMSQLSFTQNKSRITRLCKLKSVTPAGFSNPIEPYQTHPGGREGRWWRELENRAIHMPTHHTHLLVCLLSQTRPVHSKLSSTMVTANGINGVNGQASSHSEELWPSTNARGYSIPDQPCGTLHHRKVICVGAGISGICLAHYVDTIGQNLDLTIYEVASG